MSGPGGNPMDAVASLMLERQRYEQWLAALENKRAITPPHVFERVRADYEERLKQVTSQLIGRTSELKDTISALTARLGKLQTEENRRRDERYESELRAAVGEMTPDAWQALMRESDAEIGRIATERASVTTELARLQQILAMAGTKAREALEADRAAESKSPGQPAPEGVLANRPPGFDELAFLNTLVDHSQERSRGNSEAPPREPRRDGTAATAPPVPSVPPTRTPARTPNERPPVLRRDDVSVPRTTPPVEPKPEDAKPDEPPPVPSFLKDVPAEEVKTLKCAECGAMNYPTEWYCERCGAELAAM